MDLIKTALRRPVKIPEGKSGAWSVVKKIHDGPIDVVSVREMITAGKKPLRTNGSDFPITKLLQNGDVVMSDLPLEVRQMSEAARRLKGRVLVGGLGLGIIATLALKRKAVESVTVIEISEDVISLVAEHLTPRIKVLHADLFEYLRGPKEEGKFDSAFLDTWCGTGETEWVASVAPAKRGIARRFGTEILDRTVCWQEEVMLGQFNMSLPIVANAPPKYKSFWTPHEIFRRGIKDLGWKSRYEEFAAEFRRENPDGQEWLVDEYVRLKSMEDARLRALIAVFTAPGTEFWEQTWGKHWDELKKGGV